MASTYSTNLGIELMGTGDQSGTWGVTTNTNLGTLIEQAISGYQTQAITDGADTVITIPNGATGVARNMYIECTGALSANRNLVVPANKKLYFIYNNTTGGFAVTVKVSGQSGVSVPNAKKMSLVNNGTDVVEAHNYFSALGTAGSFTATGLVSTSTISATGTITGSAFIPTGSTVPAAGMYLSAANTLGFATNTVLRWSVDGSGNGILTGSSSATAFIPTGAAIPTIGVYGQTNLNFATGTTKRGSVDSNGLWNFISPTGAGATLTLNAGNAAATLAIIDSGTGNIQSFTDGTRTAVISTSANGYEFAVTSNHTLAFRTNNIIYWTIAAAGGLSNVAPASGTAVTITPAAAAAALVVNGSASTPAFSIGNSGTAFTLDCSKSNVHYVTMNGNVPSGSMTISNQQDGQTINLFLTQDGTGTRTLGFQAAIKWPGGTAGVLSTPAGSVDLLVMTYRSATSFWYATLNKAFA